MCNRNAAITHSHPNRNQQEENAEGDCLTVAAHYGTEQCYNILPFNDAASSFQLFAGTTGAVGLQLFYDLDCFGNSVEVRQFYAPSMPAGFNNQVTSCTSLSLSVCQILTCPHLTTTQFLFSPLRKQSSLSCSK
jgi:hypothetical protein